MSELWAYARIVLKADKGKTPRVLQAPGYVGIGTDEAHCIFCGKSFASLISRVRLHVAGKGVGSEAAGISPCTGVTLRENEPPEEYSAREAQFTAARARCRKENEELAAEAEAKQQKRRLDKLTDPSGFVADGAKVRGLCLALAPFPCFARDYLTNAHSRDR